MDGTFKLGSLFDHKDFFNYLAFQCFDFELRDEGYSRNVSSALN
jgi:hypothetical protein